METFPAPCGSSSDVGGHEPFTAPSSFHSRDTAKMTAASRILELYLRASENNPDFNTIRKDHDLPQEGQVKKALGDAQLMGSEL